MSATPEQPEQLSQEEAATKRRKETLGRVFDGENNDADRKKAILEMIKAFLESEFIDGANLKKTIEESPSQEDRSMFIEGMYSLIAPVFELEKTNRIEFEKLLREQAREGHNIDLNEVLYCDIDGDEAKLHLGPAKTLGPIILKRLALEGLKKLAEIIKDKEEIKTVSGTSWIFYENPGLAEKLGLTLDSEIYTDSAGEKIRKATVSKEEFLKKYL